MRFNTIALIVILITSSLSLLFSVAYGQANEEERNERCSDAETTDLGCPIKTDNATEFIEQFEKKYSTENLCEEVYFKDNPNSILTLDECANIFSTEEEDN